jgi:polyisoprenoid-binding protein YceI
VGPVPGRSERRAGIAGLALSLAVLAGVASQARTPDGSAIRFTAAQMGTPLQGSFEDFAATVDFDPEHPQGGSVHARVSVTSVNAGSREADDLLRSAGFFDAAHNAQASFDADSFAAEPGGRYRARGRFTLKGHSVDLPVSFTASQGPQGRWFDGSFAVSRLEFAVGQGEWSDTSTLDDRVEVSFHLLQAPAGK